MYHSTEHLENQIDRLRAELAAKAARIAELEAHNLRAGFYTNGGRYWEARWRDADAELATAKARIAELERHLENFGMYGNAGRYWEGRWRDAIARAERAEADADSLRSTIDNMRAMNIKLTFEATGKVLAAEAELNAMRDLLIWLNRQGGLGYEAHDRICAALNPAPAGDE